jgi:hypothetical protein
MFPSLNCSKFPKVAPHLNSYSEIKSLSKVGFHHIPPRRLDRLASSRSVHLNNCFKSASRRRATRPSFKTFAVRPREMVLMTEMKMIFIVGRSKTHSIRQSPKAKTHYNPHSHTVTRLIKAHNSHISKCCAFSIIS